MAVRKDKRKGWMTDFIFIRPDGRKIRIRKRSPDQNRKGAVEHERQLLEELKETKSNPRQRRKEVPTFNKFADEFLETYACSNYKPSVQCDAESILRVHLRPAFGNLSMDRIGTRGVEKLKADLLKRGLSRKTVNNILAMLSSIVSYAMEVKVLEERPMTKLLKIAPQKFDFLDFDEYERLLAVLDTEPLWGSAILAAGEGGFRIGEILGMFREDADHIANVITVRRALWRGKVLSTKGNSERKVPMTDRLAEALQKERHLKGDHVWCDNVGKPLTKKMAQRALQRACRRAGLRVIGWHVLRHTFCSHLAMMGAAPTSIQELAGHKHITTTMKYMHNAPAELHDAVGLLNHRKKGGKFSKRGTPVAPLRGEIDNCL